MLDGISTDYFNEDHLTAQNLAADSTLHFSLSNRDWAIILRALAPTTASLSLIEIKPKP